MPTWKLTLEYDGAAFVGWQVQPNGESVQAVVEAALARLHGGDRVAARAAGRTDAGVHARGQVVSIAPVQSLPRTAYERGLNTLLPASVAVRRAEEAPEGFEARRWARGKRYEYRVLASRAPSPLRQAQVWQVFPPLDIAAMREAARHLLGRHDFTSFRGAGCTAVTTERVVTRLDLVEQGDELRFVVEGTAFLKHMVRNFVGTLIETGQGRRGPGDMPALLAARDRTKAGITAPPQGLCLDEVFYDLAAGPPSHEPEEDAS